MKVGMLGQCAYKLWVVCLLGYFSHGSCVVILWHGLWVTFWWQSCESNCHECAHSGFHSDIHSARLKVLYGIQYQYKQSVSQAGFMLVNKLQNILMKTYQNIIRGCGGHFSRSLMFCTGVVLLFKLLVYFKFIPIPLHSYFVKLLLY